MAPFLRSRDPARPPGPRGWPLLGSLPAFRRDPLEFMVDAQRTWGDTCFFRLGPLPVYLFVRSEDIEAVLVRQWQAMHKDVLYQALRPLLGNGLVTSEDDTWRRHRKLAAPSFTPRHVATWAGAMVDHAEALAARLDDDSRHDLHHLMMRLTMAIVLSTVFGTDSDIDFDLVDRSVATFMEEFMVDAQGWRRFLPRAVPTPARLRVRRAIQAIDDAVLPVIRARRETDGDRDDLLGRLLAARDAEGGLTDRQIRDEAVTIFLAGHETTAIALTWSLALLADHPAARDRLEGEVDAVLGDARATADHLDALPFARAVVLESMRFHPPVWAIGREAVEDVEVGGWRVPAGSQILLSPWVNHHDPRWFDEPWAFRPDRWLGGLEGDLPRFAYFPFGGGPRVCLGNHFAMMEATLVLATLTRHLRFDRLGDGPIRSIPSVTLRPRDPVPVRVRRRGARRAARGV